MKIKIIKLVINPKGDDWTLVSDAAHRGIKPIPSRPPTRKRRRIKRAKNEIRLPIRLRN